VSLPRSPLALALGLLLAACAADDAATDLGALTGGKADGNGFEIPVDVEAGQSSGVFRFTSGHRFTALFLQAGDAPVQLVAETPTGSLRSATEAQPTLIVTPPIAGEQRYSVQLVNQSNVRVEGTIAVLIADGGDQTSLSLTDYVSGPTTHDSDSAWRGWEAECARAREAHRALSGAAQFLAYRCGEPREVGIGFWRYESEPTLELLAEVPAGRQPEVVRRGILGGMASDETAGLRLWRDACEGWFADLKAQLGPRFIGARCPRPEARTPWAFESVGEVYVVPMSGREVRLAGFVSGLVSASSDEAFATWEARCAAWRAGHVRRSGAHRIVSAACGAPDDAGVGTWRFESATELVLAAEADGAIPTSSTEAITGNEGGNASQGLANWQEACDWSLDDAAERWGARFVGGDCASPENLANNWGGWWYRGTMTIWLRP
jgi:hypothetical protein